MSARPGGFIDPLRITVIGSGASGLGAAFRLQQAGHRVRILERADRIGSTLRSRREHGFLLDQGAFFLTSGHTRMLRIVEEAGLLDQLVPGPLVVGALRDGKIHEARARRNLVRTIGQRRIGPKLRALFAPPQDSRSPMELLSVFRLLLGSRLVALREGMGTYPDLLSERFEVELRAEALEVLEDAGGVTLTWRDANAAEHVEPVDAVVLAVPAATVRRLLPGLDERRSRLLGEVREGHVINVNVASRSAPPDIGATYVQIPRDAHPFLAGIVLDHNKVPGRAPPGAGLLTLVAQADWSTAHRDDGDAGVAGELLGALESVLPGAVHDVQFVEVNRWSQQFNPIGHHHKLPKFLALSESCDRRVQLAGDFHMPQNLESATAAGERAAHRLLAALAPRRETAGARAEAMRQAARRA